MRKSSKKRKKKTSLRDRTRKTSWRMEMMRITKSKSTTQTRL